MRDLVYYILLGFAVFVAFEVLGFDWDYYYDEFPLESDWHSKRFWEI